MPRFSPVYELLWWTGIGPTCRTALVFHGVDSSATSPVQMAKLLTYLDRSPDLATNVTVHFDDAYETITPWVTELASRDVTVTVFVSTDIVGTEYMGRRVCDWPQLGELSLHPNVSIQSHAASHTNLTRLELSEVESELRRSKEQLEKRVGAPVMEIAYPRGKYNSNIVRIASECGYSQGWTVDNGHLGCAASSRLTLPRIVAQPRESMASVVGRSRRATCLIQRLRR